MIKLMLEPYSNHQSKLEIQNFVSALEDFKKIEQLSSIQEALAMLETTFSQEVRLQHPRQIYPIYESLTLVTNEVAKKSLSELSHSWEQVLKTLDKRHIYRIGLGITIFDTSIVQEILMESLSELQNRIVVSSIDVKTEQNRRKVVDYIFKTDREAFGTCFQNGFIEEILKSDSVRCLVARDKENEIVGILWGFLTDYQSHQLFHFWELSRKASMANMGIAKKLIDCAKEQQRLYPTLKFATLNVEIGNLHAKEIYDRENFTAFNEEEKETVKIFMANRLTEDDSVHLKPEEAKTIVTKFVLNTIPIYKLAYYELMRRCELVWKACWYR